MCILVTCDSTLTLMFGLNEQSFMTFMMAVKTCSSGVRSLHFRTMHPGGGLAYFPQGLVGSAHEQTCQRLEASGILQMGVCTELAADFEPSLHARIRAPGGTKMDWTPMSASLVLIERRLFALSCTQLSTVSSDPLQTTSVTIIFWNACCKLHL